MLRFIHSSDWHLTAGKLFDETLACLAHMVDVGRRESVDAYFLPGDFTHADLPHRVMQPAERAALAYQLIAMGDNADVWLLEGNHDIFGDVEPFGWLHGVDVCAFGLDESVWRVRRSQAYDVVAVPYPHKRHWQARRAAGAIENQRQELGATLGAALRAVVAGPMRRPNVPLIGLAHVNIAGSTTGGGEVLIGQEIELSPADLNEIGCDYWALGHIHAPQQVAERAWYCGTPQPHSFGDSNVNGFNLVEVPGPGLPPRVTFIETPAVKLCTLPVGWVGGEWRQPDGPVTMGHYPHHLRVVATVDEADRAHADWPALEQLGNGNTMSLRIERRIVPATRVRSEAIRDASSLEEKIHAFWSTLTPAPDGADKAMALDVLGDIDDA